MDLTEADRQWIRDIFRQELGRFATKDDLGRFATKEDLGRFATKEDLRAGSPPRMTSATNSSGSLPRMTSGGRELERFATKEDLERVENPFADGVPQVGFSAGIPRS